MDLFSGIVLVCVDCVGFLEWVLMGFAIGGFCCGLLWVGSDGLGLLWVWVWVFCRWL